MTTYTRIATAISHLLAASTVDSTARSEIEAVVAELHQAETSYQGQIDALTKRVAELEGEDATTAAGLASIADAADPQSTTGNDTNGLGAGSDEPAASEGDVAPPASAAGATDGGDAEAPAGDAAASGSEPASLASDSEAAAPAFEQGIAPSGDDGPAPEGDGGSAAVDPTSGAVGDTITEAPPADSLAAGEGNDTIFGG